MINIISMLLVGSHLAIGLFLFYPMLCFYSAWIDQHAYVVGFWAALGVVALMTVSFGTSLLFIFCDVKFAGDNIALLYNGMITVMVYILIHIVDVKIKIDRNEL